MRSTGNQRLVVVVLGGLGLLCLITAGCDLSSGQGQGTGLGAAILDSVGTFAGDFAHQVLAAFLL